MNDIFGRATGKTSRAVVYALYETLKNDDYVGTVLWVGSEPELRRVSRIIRNMIETLDLELIMANDHEFILPSNKFLLIKNRKNGIPRGINIHQCMEVWDI